MLGRYDPKTATVSREEWNRLRREERYWRNVEMLLNGQTNTDFSLAGWTGKSEATFFMKRGTHYLGSQEISGPLADVLLMLERQMEGG